MASVFKLNGIGNYQIEWKDYRGKILRKSSLTTDYATAKRIAAKLEADVALRREGVIDPAMEELNRQGRRPLDEHLEDYEARLRVNGSEGHVKMTMSYIRKIISFAGWKTAAEINPDPVNRYSGKLQAEKKSNRTRQAYVRAIKGFTSRLAKDGKLQRDPLAGVNSPVPSKDRRYERRMLLPEEWKWVETATIRGPVRKCMAGVERALLYLTALLTGLRSAELRSLTRGNLFLDGEKPYLLVKAGDSKDGKQSQQYIPAELADDLRKLAETKPPGSLIFRMPPNTKVAAMIQEDLLQARQEWLASSADPKELKERERSDFLAKKNHEGKVFDFHSLRHTFGSWLVQVGVNPKAVQRLMRHSDITLTMDTYGHLLPGQEAKAIVQLQGLMGPRTPLIESNKNGLPQTEGKYVSANVSKRSAPRGIPSAIQCSPEGELCPKAKPEKREKTGARSGTRRPATMPCLSEAPLAQLAEQLTLNQ